MLLYEERRIRLKLGAFAEYRRWALNELWPALEEAGALPLCLLNGLIGQGIEDVVLFVRTAPPTAARPHGYLALCHSLNRSIYLCLCRLSRMPPFPPLSVQ